MKISIVTINYNNLEGLKKTVQSVLLQSYANIEYVIIDGGSNEGSKEYIKEQKSRFSYCVSEPDGGIYDAMNKGVEKISGDYVLFLNSGDTLFNKNVIQNFIDISPIEDIVYGNSMFVTNSGKTFLKKMPDSLEGMMIFKRTLNHQVVFHKSSLFNKMKYDLSYKVLADWAFYNTVVLINGGSYRHIDLLVSNYDFNGFSSNPNTKTLMDKDRMLFYSRHVDYFIPLLLEENKRLQKELNKLRNPAVLKLLKKGMKRIKNILNSKN